MTEAANWGLYAFSTDTEIFNRAWWVHAPWAHPVWHSYAIFLYDLHTVSDVHGPAKKKRADLTHEVAVLALDPAHVPGSVPVRPLQPANHMYQFAAESDEAAEQRIADLVARIVRHELSPDTDYRSVWDQIFEDGETLLVSTL